MPALPALAAAAAPLPLVPLVPALPPLLAPALLELAELPDFPELPELEREGLPDDELLPLAPAEPLLELLLELLGIGNDVDELCWLQPASRAATAAATRPSTGDVTSLVNST